MSKFNICSSQECSGCAGCVNICPKNCITIKTAEYGEDHPVIDYSKCIQCKLCHKVCPQNWQPVFRSSTKCYAAYGDIKQFADSASGGVAACLYNTFLSQHDDAYVAGVIYDKDMNAVFKIFRKGDELLGLRGSKYVQAKIGLVIKECERILVAGHSLLFVGVPCQIAALLNYMSIRRVNTDKLVTVDLLCHGVSPQHYLDEEISYLRKKYNWDSVKNITFRSNRKFRNFHIYIEAERKGKKCVYNRYSQEDPYFYGFLEGITLRESCYHCMFSQEKRVGDLTIGDFIGLGKMLQYPEYKGKKKENVSLVLVQTEKGANLINQIRNVLYFEERNIKEAIAGGLSLKEPFKPSEVRGKFLDMYSDVGFLKAMHAVSGRQLNKNKMKLGFKRVAAQAILNTRRYILLKNEN